MCLECLDHVGRTLCFKTLYVELAHHNMLFGATEVSCFGNPGVCYGMRMLEHVMEWYIMDKDGRKLIDNCYVLIMRVRWRSRSSGLIDVGRMEQ